LLAGLRLRSRLRSPPRSPRTPAQPAGRFGDLPSRGGHARRQARVAPVSATLRQTPLHDAHVGLGARMVPFAGWEMPVQYEGVIPEHMAVRTRAGAFDVSHMGQLHVDGPAAQPFLQSVLSNDVDRVQDGGAQYTLLTTESGGIVDDLIVYRLSHGCYLLVVNAGNRQTAYEWLKRRAHARDEGRAIHE